MYYYYPAQLGESGKIIRGEGISLHVGLSRQEGVKLSNRCKIGHYIDQMWIIVIVNAVIACWSHDFFCGWEYRQINKRDS